MGEAELLLGVVMEAGEFGGVGGGDSAGFVELKDWCWESGECAEVRDAAAAEAGAAGDCSECGSVGVWGFGSGWMSGIRYWVFGVRCWVVGGLGG